MLRTELTTSGPGAPAAMVTRPDQPQPESSGDKNRATGLAIADQLVEQAIWSSSGDACTFAGAGAPLALGQPAPHVTIDAGLYEGTSGVARFLLLADRVEPGRYSATADAALHHAIRRAHGWSLFSGALGVGVVAMQHANPTFVEAGTHLVEASIEQARMSGEDAPADLLAGLAGVVVGLDAVLDHAPSPGVRARWLNAMTEFGDVLRHTAMRNERGMSWPVLPDSDDHLCGLAHGASGIAYAMQRLHVRDPDSGPWLAMATEARDWERLHFSQTQGSWADLRSDDPPVDLSQLSEPICPHMWCHGSTGIAAERLGADASDTFAALDRIAALDAVTFSTRAVLAAPMGVHGSHANNASICHGLSGSIDVLLDAAQVAHDPAPFRELADQAADAIRLDAEQAGQWRCGIPDAAEAPGLMIGLAGIGWTMLRLADPDGVPSVWRLTG